MYWDHYRGGVKLGDVLSCKLQGWPITYLALDADGMMAFGSHTRLINFRTYLDKKLISSNKITIRSI